MKKGMLSRRVLPEGPVRSAARRMKDSDTRVNILEGEKDPRRTVLRDINLSTSLSFSDG